MKNLFSEALLLCRFKFKLTQYLLLLILLISNSVAAQNLALNRPVYASSVQSVGFEEAKVNDGDYSTFWSSSYNDDEWIYIDLEKNRVIEQVKIYWEGAYAKHYEVEICLDNDRWNWKTYHSSNNNDGNLSTVELSDAKGRWLRINCIERATVYGNAITEIEIYGLKGEQLSSDGTATDQDGNTFEWINYGTQDWAIENAEVVTYRDGTPIPQVTSTDWISLKTGAWCYYDNDTTKGKLYNWYAVKGIYDEASLNDESIRKQFAPEGWHIPSEVEWDSLVLYLIENLYNYDSTPINEWSNFNSNKLAKALASTTDWATSTLEGAIGNDLSLNNRSGFNIFPTGNRHYQTQFSQEGESAFFWLSDDKTFGYSYFRGFVRLDNNWSHIQISGGYRHQGNSVRFVRDAATASTKDYSKPAAIYPNPTSSVVTIEGGAYNIEVYSLQGRKLMTHKGNRIDLSTLSNAMYIIKATNTANKQQQIYKVIKE